MAGYLYFSNDSTSLLDPKTLHRIEPTRNFSFESRSYNPRQSLLGGLSPCIWEPCRNPTRVYILIIGLNNYWSDFNEPNRRKVQWVKEEVTNNSNRDVYLYSWSSIATTLSDSKDGVVAFRRWCRRPGTCDAFVTRCIFLPTSARIGTRRGRAVLVLSTNHLPRFGGWATTGYSQLMPQVVSFLPLYFPRRSFKKPRRSVFAFQNILSPSKPPRCLHPTLFHREC